MTEPVNQPATVELPTQILFPLRTALRTAIQAGLAVAFAFAVSNLPALSGVLPDSFSSVVADALTAVVVAVAAAVFAWIMSRPAVNDFLSKIGLAAKPKP